MRIIPAALLGAFHGPRGLRRRVASGRAEAEALIQEFWDEAYSGALRREREAGSDDMANDWSRVAVAVAQKLRRHAEVTSSTRIAMNALFVPDRNTLRRACREVIRSKGVPMNRSTSSRRPSSSGFNLSVRRLIAVPRL